MPITPAATRPLCTPTLILIFSPFGVLILFTAFIMSSAIRTTASAWPGSASGKPPTTTYASPMMSILNKSCFAASSSNLEYMSFSMFIIRLGFTLLLILVKPTMSLTRMVASPNTSATTSLESSCIRDSIVGGSMEWRRDSALVFSLDSRSRRLYSTRAFLSKAYAACDSTIHNGSKERLNTIKSTTHVLIITPTSISEKL
mmetsp:Transcript_21084/g.54807  ORF Transcript_21084/g.54807 Transcript_21084/m.54807 type:complete len:201 (-) Transcript_21084:1045-1647(-)